MLLRHWTPLLLALSLLGCASTRPTNTQTFSFGLWGDMPYKKTGDEPRLPAVLQSINASDIAFSLYDGDIKDGSSKCTDDIYTDALQMFASMQKPVVYIPGDNEWTDCHRLNNGGYDGLERLGHLRRVMFPTQNSLGRNQMALEHQGQPGQKYVENIRFSHGGIVFVGLNIPGSNNNLVLSAKECSDKSARKTEQCDAGNADKPLYSPTRMLTNLTRLQTFGSPSLHWVRMTVDPASDNVFTVHPVIVPQP